MEGLCEQVSADAWVWTLGPQMKPNKAQVFVGFLKSGFDDERFSRYLKAVEHPDMAFIASRFAEEIAKNKSHTTMRRQDIDLEQQTETSPVGALWDDADIGSLMLSAHPLDEDTVSIVGMYRRKNEPIFSKLERQLVHIVLSEVPWLHEMGWPEDRGVKVPRLYPKQRLVLNLLLDGMSRKKIADKLSLSENTIAGYAKDVYRHFGVNSHVELMRRFLHSESSAS